MARIFPCLAQTATLPPNRTKQHQVVKGTSTIVFAQPLHAKTAERAFQAELVALLANAKRDSRETRACKTPGPALLTLAQITQIAQIWAMTTGVTVGLDFPEKIATKDFIAIARHARTEVRVMKRKTGQPSVSALQVIRVLTVPKTWMSAPAHLVKTEACVKTHWEASCATVRPAHMVERFANRFWPMLKLDAAGPWDKLRSSALLWCWQFFCLLYSLL